MKLERLLSIIILLLNRRIVQAKELAERFEVSIRTIYRDIDTINGAGIPIVTYQGANGGIGLAEGYRLDRNILTNDELAAIVTALRSISTSYSKEQNQRLVEKINSVVSPADEQDFLHKTNRVLIDLSPWDRCNRLMQKLQTLEDAVKSSQLVKFTYSDAEGNISQRVVEPYTLILKGRQWYVQAYCLGKEAFRLFKLKRMKDLSQDGNKTFIRRVLPTTVSNPLHHYVQSEQTSPVPEIVIRFQAEARHLAEEWFGTEEISLVDDGSWEVRKAYPENEWLYSFILGLGHQAEVLEPTHLRQIIASRANKIAERYKNNEAT